MRILRSRGRECRIAGNGSWDEQLQRQIEPGGTSALSVLLLIFSMVFFGGLFSATHPSVDAAETAGAASGSSNTPAAGAAELVEKLGDPRFATREAAAAQLAEMGLPAMEALRAGLKHADPQVRRSARWLLDRVADEDLKRKLAAFESGEQDPTKINLPCWKSFAETVGDTPESRQLFGAMLRADAALLETLETDPESAGELLSRRLQWLIQRVSGVRVLRDGRVQTVADDPTKPLEPAIAACLFAAGEPRMKWAENYQTQSWFQSLFSQPRVQELIRRDSSGAVRRLAGRWMLAPVSIYLVQQKLNSAVMMNLREGADLAASVIEAGTQPIGNHLMPILIGAIGLCGGMEYAGVLEGLLQNETVLYRGPNNQQTQVRDVALAWLLVLTGQKFADYGWQRAGQTFEQLARTRQLFLNHAELAFPDDQTRQAALNRWRDYVARHPLPAVPKWVKVSVDRNPPGQQLATPVKTEEVAPVGAAELRVQPADRLTVQSLNTARELCRAGRYAEGVRLLDEILSLEEESAYQPTGRVPLFRSLKAEAESLLVQLPPEGRASYRLQFGAAARTALAQAVAEGGVEQLRTVAERYFFTEAGAEAAFLTAEAYLERGDAFRAALYYQRLRTLSPEADRFEPALSLRLCGAYLAAGVVEGAESAAKLLVQHSQRKAARNDRWIIGGEARERFARAGDVLRWLDDSAGIRAAREAVSGWLMHRGDPTRNRVCLIDAPYLNAEPLLSLLDNRWVQEHLAEIRKSLHDAYRPALPRLFPLVVGKLIVFRSATHLHAVDFATGKLVWEAGLEDGLRRYLQWQSDPAETPAGANLVRGLQRRFFEDQLFGALSSDGRYVFGVEDLPFGFGTELPMLSVGPDGRRRLDSESPNRGNMLTAHELSTGKLKWEIGGPSGSGLPLAGVRFLGPPLPLGERLYVCALIGSHRSLIELDADSGHPLNIVRLNLPDPTDGEDNPRQGLVFVAGVVQSPLPPPPAAAAPSYSDGVLVCQFSDHQFAAIDLASRAIRWVYHLAEAETSRRSAMVFNLAARAGQNDPVAAGNRWIDSGVTIARGRVLLTPTQVQEVLCLDLADGRFLWSAPRRDGLYVGGVVGDRVIVVGRSAVWALDLETGRPAWKHDRLLLPAGAMPSGQGLPAEGQYHLPLSNGEVVTIDVASGAIVVRARGDSSAVPGNLVAAHDHLIAQSPEGLWRFETLAGRDRRLAEESARRPDDPELLRQRGEILLARGRLDEAVEVLRRSAELQPEPRTHRLLVEAIGEGLRKDFDRYQPLVEKYEPLATAGARKSGLLREWAAGLHSAGRLSAAFEVYLRLCDGVENPTAVERFEGGRSVQTPRWLAARLHELRRSAQGEEAHAIDRAVERWLAAADASSLDRRLSFVANHPAAYRAALHLAEAKLGEPLPLTLHAALEQISRYGDGSQRQSALSLLVRGPIARQMPHDAAEYLARLAELSGNGAAIDGMTAVEYLRALPPEHPLAAAYRGRANWPAVKPRVEQIALKPADPGMQRLTITVRCDDGFTLRDLPAEVDLGKRTITAYDTQGRIRWRIAAAEGFDAGLLQQMNTRYVWLIQRGRLLVGWFGQKAVGIDLGAEPPKVLWQYDTMRSPSAQFAMAQMMRQRANQIGPITPTERPPLVFNSAGVFIVQDNDLLAIDPLTGDMLWRRMDLPDRAIVFGSERMLFVVGEDEAEAAVIDPWDGGELGRRTVPKPGQWLAAEGERILVWQPLGDRRELGVYDPWAQSFVWRQLFPEKALATPVGGDEVAVFEPQGRFAVLSCADGRMVTDVPLEELADAGVLLVQRNAEAYCIVVGRDLGPGNVIIFPFITSRVDGYAAAVGRDDGKLRWLVDLQQQGIGADVFPDLPVMVFFSQYQEIVQNRGVFRSRLMCLDRRTGRLLFESPEGAAHQPQWSRVEIVPDADNRTIEVRAMVASVRLDYKTPDAAVPAPDAQPQGGNE